MSDSGAVNYGVQQSGGVSQVGNQAVGPGAYAVGGTLSSTPTPTGADLSALLGTLLQVLDRHAAQLTPPARVAAADLRAELGAGRPAEPARVTVLLHRLAEVATPVAPVAVAVAEVLRAVQGG
ncbi:hypothetical protein [Micromonospora fluostatini]|uniref:hypothetical protein n=1 Tax=Micromonospora sp. JCM 30529 TaxID=3421643 RepID=UPI003D1723C6